MIQYYLRSEETHETILTTEFDRQKIEEAIVQYLEENPNDSLSFEKDWNTKELDKKYLGKEVLDFYEINPHSGEPSKVVEKYNHNRGWRRLWFSLYNSPNNSKGKERFGIPNNSS